NDCVISQSSAINCNIVSYQTLRSKWVETDPGYSSVRSGQSRFVTIDPRAAFPEKNYYNLSNDPNEMNNLYGNQGYEDAIDSLIKLGDNTLAMMSSEIETLDSTILDEETIRRLKELGYLK
ncbi:MAG: hypothetical protein GY855_09315, partial [candidate division Zixibacteria bacterium]|nr:hypothetical protein [candidate division Zixibacteria bacterium]